MRRAEVEKLAHHTGTPARPAIMPERLRTRPAIEMNTPTDIAPSSVSVPEATTTAAIMIEEVKSMRPSERPEKRAFVRAASSAMRERAR